ncbi:Y-family DNA polymerase [Kangiella japonica]|uniref:Y-family DNA polymerase n=1 Tax=Kangiella japonica TaxID=647384 RepID=A0ABN0SWT4_9GAMM
MSKMFALCDVNNFYVSCERLFNPALRNRPVIVLSNNDGCAVARSNEAKAIGIKMGAPLHKIQDIVRKHNVQVLSSNYALYGDLSNRFVSVLERSCDQVEQYSIDESFLLYEGFKHTNLIEHNQEIVKTVQQWLGLPICIGLAPSKTLAKIANHYAKSLAVPNGVLELNSRYTVKNALENLPVSEIWGVGRRLSEKLNKVGIHTALQLRNADYKTLQRMFSVNMERTVLELRGKSCIALEDSPPPKKQIVCSRSFSNKTDDLQLIREAIAYHVTRGCETLRKQGSLAKSMTVGIRTNPFSAQDKQYCQSITLSLPEATDHTGVFLKSAMRGLQEIYKKGFLYKKVGIMLNDLSTAEGHQKDFFMSVKSSPELMQAVDSINAKYGKGTAKFALQGFNQKWSMKSERRSKDFTSNWNDIVKVK